eukprot:Awhi_evm1s4519
MLSTVNPNTVMCWCDECQYSHTDPSHQHDAVFQYATPKSHYDETKTQTPSLKVATSSMSLKPSTLFRNNNNFNNDNNKQKIIDVSYRSKPLNNFLDFWCHSTLNRQQLEHLFHKLIDAGDISSETIAITLIYSKRFQRSYPASSSEQVCGACLLVGCLVLACKYLQEVPYTNTFWANLSNIGLKRLNAVEVWLLQSLLCELYVTPEEADQIQHDYEFEVRYRSSNSSDSNSNGVSTLHTHGHQSQSQYSEPHTFENDSVDSHNNHPEEQYYNQELSPYVSTYSQHLNHDRIEANCYNHFPSIESFQTTYQTQQHHSNIEQPHHSHIEQSHHLSQMEPQHHPQIEPSTLSDDYSDQPDYKSQDNAYDNYNAQHNICNYDSHSISSYDSQSINSQRYSDEEDYYNNVSVSTPPLYIPMTQTSLPPSSYYGNSYFSHPIPFLRSTNRKLVSFC